MADVPAIRLMTAVVRRPGLWAEAMRALPAYAPRGWWRRRPYLPLPDPEYLRWRLVTAYGEVPADLEEHDLVAFLDWRRRQRL